MSFGFGMGFPRAASAAGGPTLNFQFAGATEISSQITFTRASTGSYYNSAGVLSSAATNAPRFDYNPSTLAAQGLLIEEARTNSIRNNTMVGAVAGTPGTLPTNWNVITSGMAFNVIGTGTENGISYIDIQAVGTTTASSSGVRFEATNQVVASNGQSWTGSFYVRQVAGATTNITSLNTNVFGRTAANVANADDSSSANFLSTISQASLSVARRSFSLTLAAATTAFVSTQLLFTHSIGVAIDITLRIGLPQLELGAFATSVIPTTTTALTRAADVASVNTLSPWYNSVEGTLYVQAQDMSDAAHNTSQPRAVSINNGSTSAIDISRLPASAQGRARVDDAGVNQFNSLTTAWPLATQAKVALAYKANDFAACLGGGAVFTDALGSVPTVTTLTIGNFNTAGGNSWVGWIQRITYYPRRLSNAELITLTT